MNPGLIGTGGGLGPPIWSMEEAYLQQTVVAPHERYAAMVQNGIQPPAQCGGLGTREASADSPLRLIGNAARIDVTGMMRNHLFWWERYSYSGRESFMTSEYEAATYEAIERGVDLLATFFDSPGGTTENLRAYGDAVFSAREAGIRTVAFCKNMCASAAYRIAALHDEIYVAPDASVGSIGTFSVLRDTSAAAAEWGSKVYVMGSNALKGDQVSGVEISQDVLDEWQRRVDETNELFLFDLQRGRGLSEDEAKALDDGTLHVGQHAVDYGLADGVKTLREIEAELFGDTDTRPGSSTRSDANQITPSVSTNPPSSDPEPVPTPTQKEPPTMDDDENTNPPNQNGGPAPSPPPPAPPTPRALSAAEQSVLMQYVAPDQRARNTLVLQSIPNEDGRAAFLETLKQADANHWHKPTAEQAVKQGLEGMQLTPAQEQDGRLVKSLQTLEMNLLIQAEASGSPLSAEENPMPAIYAALAASSNNLGQLGQRMTSTEPVKTPQPERPGTSQLEDAERSRLRQQYAASYTHFSDNELGA